MKISDIAGPELNRLQRIALVVGVVGLALSVAGALLDGAGFFHSYLFAYLFWVGATVGSLSLLMLHHVVGGGWGYLLRRMWEAATRLLPLMLVLFLPILLGMSSLYEWTLPGAASDPVLSQKTAYLNVPFFVVRTVFYFAVWMVLAYFLNRWSTQQDETNDPMLFHRLNLLSAGGIVAVVLTVTFASVDWVMSLTPHWFSSILGLVFVASQALSSMALMLVLFAFLAADSSLVRQVRTRYFRDLGNLLLTLVLLWAYLSFSQYLIIYSGNIAEEAAWYTDRRVGGWGALALTLIVTHFALPFLILLVGSNVKRNPARLAWVAGFLVVMRLLDLYWWVTPTFRNHLSVSLSDVGLPLALGGLWVWMWVGQLRDRSVVPAQDPRLAGHWPLGEVAGHG